ncbi:hypothetical protein ABW19_dt0204689 [Dactylella cylindrospora]|nr:hypothetical protein ABW19_dt0204689 [Dactylella cylindrospora]
MQAAKHVVSEFLHHGKKHTVDVNRETKPAVLHEKVTKRKHENVTHAVDREIHQHHHQIHVQPVTDKVVENEKHHHNLVPVEHRSHYHGKDREIATKLAHEHERFRDEQQVLPVEATSSSNVVVGEHVHHHVHDYIQPVIERERIVPHIVHTTVPIHEHIEHEPYIHEGNVLPTMTMAEFTRAGHTLNGSKGATEHIEYEGEPLRFGSDFRGGFGLGASSYTHHKKSKSKSRSRSTSSVGEEDGRVPRSMATAKKGTHHKSSLLDKLNPRIRDASPESSRV